MPFPGDVQRPSPSARTWAAWKRFGPVWASMQSFFRGPQASDPRCPRGAAEANMRPSEGLGQEREGAVWRVRRRGPLKEAARKASSPPVQGDFRGCWVMGDPRVQQERWCGLKGEAI